MATRRRPRLGQWEVYIVPHFHYDAAWLETYEGYLRITHPHILEVLRALEMEPGFKFVFDQVALLEPFLERYPEQEEKLKRFVEEGRIELTCGMFVMPDVNLPGGESLIRQVLLGQEFFQREFGVRPKVGYMLDVFGNHPQMPQIMVGLGFTSYIFGRVRPPDSPADFYWEGLDGTRILTHWMPYHYVDFWPAPTTQEEFEAFAQAAIERMKPYATGKKMLLFNGMDFVPPQPHVVPLARWYNETHSDARLHIVTPSEYLEAIRSEDLPVVQGDFNAVFQGCYSSRIRLKQENRRLENLLLSAEAWMAVASLVGSVDLEQHQQEMKKAWRKVLFNHFHDVLCGCHVDAVYEEAMEGYRVAGEMGSRQLETALAIVSEHVSTLGPGVPVLVFNTLAWPRTDVASVVVTVTQPGVRNLGVLDAEGNPVPSQLEEVVRYSDGGLKSARVFFLAEVPGLGYALYHIVEGALSPSSTTLKALDPIEVSRHHPHQCVLENEFYRLTLDNWGGVITSLLYKPLDWEVIDPARPYGNVITKEPDHGDLWEINGPCKGGATSPTHRPFPFPQPWEAEFSMNYGGAGVSRWGPVFAEWELGSPFGKGWRHVKVRLYHRVARIEFETRLRNEEEWVRYRAAFPTSLKGGRIVQEIPFGAWERPEGEFPAQNWMDYSDGRRGVALLNQGLPGNGVSQGVMMLSLLRAVRLRGHPTEGAFEKGVEHLFRYALVPHAGDYREALIPRAALEFNHPLGVRKVLPHPGSLPPRQGFLEVEPRNLLVSSVRPKERGWLVRLYEVEGQRRTRFALRFARPPQKAYETNLLEERSRARVYLEGGTLYGHLRAFQIRSYEVHWERP